MTSENQTSNASKKLIIFDFDGVIGDTFKQVYEASNEASIEFGFTPFSSEEEFYNDLNITIFNAPSLLIKRFQKHGFFAGTKGAIHQVLNTKKFKVGILKYFGPKISESTYFKGIPELLIKLQGKAEMVILTNNVTTSVQEFLLKFDLLKYFSEVHGFEGTMVKTEKLNQILDSRKLGLDDAIFVTDMASDIKDAQPTGIKVLAVTYGYNTREKIERKHPEKIIDSVEEIYPSLQEMLFDNK